jgi:hypothetical protein
MSNLLEKASIITTPTAYSDGFLHSVKPERTLGSELVVNGDFSNGSTDWTLNDWTVADGKASIVNGSSFITQTLVLQSGKTYKIQYTISDYVSGNIRWRSAGVNGSVNTSNGLVTDFITVASSSFSIQGYNSFTGSISNISAKEVTDADFTFTRNDAGTRVNASGNIESVGVDLPRIDYRGGSGSLLLEPQATNTATDSNDFSQGSIFVTSGNPLLLNSLTLTANATTSPEGLTNASKIQIGSTNSAINRVRYSSVNIVSGNVNVISIFAKKGSGVDWFGIFADGFDIGTRAWFDLENGVVGSASVGVLDSKIEDYGNGWYRCSMSFSSVDSIGVVSLVITNADNTAPYSGDLTDHHFIYGLQAESHATREYATSYIPTSGDIQTRAADIATDAGSSDLISSTEGVLYTEIAALANDNTNKAISINNSGTTDSLTFRYRSTNDFQILFKAGNINIVNEVFSLSNNLDFNKIAFSYKLNEFKIFVNGLQIGSTITSGDVFSSTVNNLDFSKNTGTSDFFYGKVKCVAVFKEALTDAELTCLTTPNISRIFNDRVLWDGGIIESLECVTL